MISFLFETFLFYFLLSLLINQNIIFQIRDDFLRPFPCLDVEIQCQMREACDAKYRIQKALLGNICGNTGTDRSQPFKMKFNTHHLRPSHPAFSWSSLYRCATTRACQMFYAVLRQTGHVFIDAKSATALQLVPRPDGSSGTFTSLSTQGRV